ncbi:phenylalanine--tRNA ligase subunit beta [Candidatus Saccharibacteria bacterium CPR2]|nr:phenylalanine--tRNA ligase subunit beta [Candidatus Saccharibacteria bacterium CPR2]
MKISVNWLKELGVNLPEDRKELMRKISSQLGAIESTADLEEKYFGAYIVKVTQCQKHKDADKLKVCLIDDDGKNQDVSRNSDGYIQVVCGADNVEKGQTVVWLKPGAVVPSTYKKENFKLDVREIRGETSNGMIASERELDLGSDHSGILVVDEDIQIGSPFAESFGLDDFIIEVENKMFTNRPDCFGMLGLAREVSGIYGQKFQSPDWFLVSDDSKQPTADSNLKFEVENEIPELVPRFTMVALDNIKVGPSPLWLKSYLIRMGQKSVNNVVDLTNYLMFLTGQPLHAFDYDKVAKLSSEHEARIIIRRPKQGEELMLLDGKTIEPHSEAILICTDEKPIALAGVMGGKETEVDENTTRILLEVANFDLYSIRRTSMKHGIFTEAVTRFSKGQSPEQCDKVSKYAVELLCQEAGANIASDFIDVSREHAWQENEVKTDSKFISLRLGHEFAGEEITSLLGNVEFSCQSNENLSVKPPFWRKDINIAEDVVEEVGRLFGYEKLSLSLPKRSLKPPICNGLYELEKSLKVKMISGGASEVYSYNFLHGNLLDAASQPKEYAYHIRNAISPELQYMRVSLLPGLLSKVHANIKRGHESLALVETGTVHVKGVNDKIENNLPEELPRLAFVFSASDGLAKKYPGAPFYYAKKYLEFALAGFEISYQIPKDEYEYIPSRLALAPFDKNRSASVMISETNVGFVGEFNDNISKKLKLPGLCAGFEIGLNPIAKLLSADIQASYKPLSKFPSSHQDISFAIKSSVSYGELEAALAKSLDRKSLAVNIEPLDIYRKDHETKHISFKLNFTDSEKTLTTEEVNEILEEASKTVCEKFKATRL